MKNPIFDRAHLCDYLVYGGVAAVAFCLPVCFFLAKALYADSWVVYLGTVLFMFVIMAYSIKLTRKKSDDYSAVKMMMAGQLAVLSGIVLSVLLSIVLCLIYIPGFMSGDSQDAFLINAPEGMNHNNAGTLLQVFLPATIGNFGAGAFISVVVSYVIKPNQTKDKPAPL